MRYIIDKRIGCVAIIDTEHESYKDEAYRSNGLSPDLRYVVEFWSGYKDEDDGNWYVMPSAIEDAEKQLEILNDVCPAKGETK